MQCKYNRNVPLDFFSPPKYGMHLTVIQFLSRGADRRELLCAGFEDHVVLIQLVDL